MTFDYINIAKKMFHYYGKEAGAPRLWLGGPADLPFKPQQPPSEPLGISKDDSDIERLKKELSDAQRERDIAREHAENNQNIILKMSSDWTKSNDELSQINSETKEAYQSLTKQQAEEISNCWKKSMLTRSKWKNLRGTL